MATEYAIIESASHHVEATANLASWSGNYDHPTPFALFLDIIGVSDEQYGEPMFDLKQCPSKMGFLEIGMLGEALREYADNPGDVTEWVNALLAADGNDD